MQRILLFLLSTIVAIPALAEGGVSHRLAVERAERVSRVEYRLGFTIPADKTKPVTFTDTVTFKLSGNGDLWLDYRPCAVAAVPRTLTINGRTVRITAGSGDVCFSDEHIIISGRLLKEGLNTVVVSGISDDKTLNRHGDYLYTLFVPANARSVFPCFDQPDLKATFRLSLRLPEGWTAISSCGDRPLPTYLFSFTAGRFFRREAVRDGRTLTALYRETDPKKVAQLDTVFDEVALSLRWLERYTGISMPFSRYGFAVLPGYQFGGMEHPGAIQFIDREIFLGDHPTPDEELTRLNLIAHETAHLWFGDMVTMRWFNDVWTKEVFANLMASKIARVQFPQIDHDLNFIHSYYMRAMSTDRTDGTHPIQQDLENLNQAGLLYGNIIYQKAPIMMQKLEELMDSDRFRQGLQVYLKRFAYRNATWDDLVAILDSVAPGAGVLAFSDVWVKQKGMPTITTEWNEKGILTIHQRDPYGRGLVWPQRVNFRFDYDDSQTTWTADTTLQITDTLMRLRMPQKDLSTITVNADGKGYGRFAYNENELFDYPMDALSGTSNVRRYAAGMNLMNGMLPNAIDEGVSPQTAVSIYNFVLDLEQEHNPLIASALCSYASLMMSRFPTKDVAEGEACLYRFTKPMLTQDIGDGEVATLQPNLPNVRKTMLRYLGTSATSPAVVDSIYKVWRDQSSPLLDRSDYTRLAYHLAIMMPGKWQDILKTQRARLTNADELAAFDYISRACSPDTLVQDSLFESLRIKENRRVEPWTASMLALLNDPVREPRCNRYILPALDMLTEIQQTGDIFFPSNWLSALLSGHRSKEAAGIVSTWLQNHRNYFPPLRRKLQEASWMLRIASESHIF